jgi:hypothetical protein
MTLGNVREPDLRAHENVAACPIDVGRLEPASMALSFCEA